jgi:hypothetical protein
MGSMMGRMLTQPVLPLLPEGAEEIAPGAGVPAGEDGGGPVTVHGLATFVWDGGDEAGRRMAAVQLVRLVGAAPQGQVTAAFGVDAATRCGGGIRRWSAAGCPAWSRPGGAEGASKLTAELAARIRELDTAGETLRQIAAATGCRRSPSAAPSAGSRPGLGNRSRRARRPAPCDGGRKDAPGEQEDGGEHPEEHPPVLPDPVPRYAERALARWGRPGEGADPVFVPGARYPLAGLLPALPPLEDTGPRTRLRP